MHQGKTSGKSTGARLAAAVRGVLAAAVVLALPAFALSSVLAAPSADHELVVIEHSDDAVANGLHILERRPQQTPAVQHVQVIGSDDFARVLNDWTFTSKNKPKPSPKG
ncbi:MAG: hypothetical protein L0Y71_18170 [Gemmataceae bacterium]|nr:hypothetical protein [Gemmataceae bacterium]